MKKIIYLLMANAVIVGGTSNVVACNIGDFSTRAYLELFEDFDWTGNQTSDGDSYNWKYDQSGFSAATQVSDNIFETEEVDATQGVVDKIFNYDSHSTSYKGYNFIKKQATTGSPIIKSYRPNGNKWLDFGLDSRSRKYNYINSIIDWNDGTDLDLPYNVAREKLAGRNYVAKKTVDSQQEKTFFNLFHDPSISSSSIIGTKSPFGGNLTNLSYTHETYTWPAITNKGWITSSFADNSEYMHKNGVPVLGLWYMSGWEDLTRESLKSVLEKDSNGTYKIVNILIQQCIELNFDGWFINNEGNGSSGDGFVIQNSELNEIMRQFNFNAEQLEDRLGRRLSIVYYTNGGSLDYDESTQQPYSKKTVEAARTATSTQLDFTTSVPSLDTYLKLEKNSSEEERKNIYSLLNESISLPGVGAFEYKNMIFKNGDSTKDPNNSFAIFGSGGANEYSKSFRNWAIGKKLVTSENEWQYMLMQQELSSLYSTLQMSGKNGYLENTSHGFSEMISHGQKSLDSIYQADPRVRSISFDKGDSSGNEQLEQYFALTNGKYDYSTGIGNSFLEKTVIADTVIKNDYSKFSGVDVVETANDPSMTTYFSTGSGIKFINRNNSGDVLYDGLTPWTNSRVGDVGPTYQWDFFTKKIIDGSTKIVTTDGDKYVSRIGNKGQLTGYYDYHNPFMKGNSISIGMGYDFDDEGKVIAGEWKTGQDYFWNIMGTNLSQNKYQVDFVVRASDENGNVNTNFNVADSIAVTYTDQTDSNFANSIATTATKISGDGWYKVSADLSSLSKISSSNRIARLGLKINSASESNFLFSVGAFSISNKSSSLALNSDTKVTNISSDYIVKRETDDHNVNVRFSWNADNDLAKYYNLFYSTDNVNWYRLGQTTLNRHYLRELSENEGQYIYIGVQPVSQNDNVGKTYYSRIDTVYNYKK